MDQVLTPLEYSGAEAHGLQRLLEFAAPADLAMTRFVVRDRATGNLGLVDVVFNFPEEPFQRDAAMLGAPDKQLHTVSLADNSFLTAFESGAFDPYADPIQGPVGSYGSVVPAAHAFCGDVFELKPGIRVLPDFRELDSIGSIYTSSLAVPYQNLPANTGIPGVTDRIAWFGVDYHATFWVSNPGKYEFKLMSDDGALLQIDDKRVINNDYLHCARRSSGIIVLDAGRHTIHVPYFEGTPTGVALALWVRTPGEKDWKLFDLREFEEPLRNKQ